MKFAIAKSFERSLKQFYHANNNEFAQIQITLMKIGNEYSTNGLNCEKILDFVSFRVNKDIRIIAVLHENQLTMVYVDHHDQAYAWCHNNQPVVIKNGYIGSSNTSIQKNDATLSKDYNFLLEHGFPVYFVDTLNRLNKGQVKDFIKFISPEYQQLILMGENYNTNLMHKGYVSDIIVINDDQELERALKLCYDDWAIYLHPNQKDVVDYPIGKSLMIYGGPGTGKTIAMIWRYVRVYNESDKKHKPVFIYRSEITKQILTNLIQKLDQNITPIFEKTDDTAKKIIKIYGNRHYFIDEAQDLSINFIMNLYELIKKNYLTITLAVDFRQSVLSTSNIDKKCDLLHTICCKNLISLDYCYRSTE